MKRDCIQRVIVNETDVPPGYVPLKSFGSRSNGESGSPEYELIHAAYRNRRIDAVKHMRTPTDHSGLVFVDGKQADQLILKSGLRASVSNNPPQKSDPGRWAYAQGESACISLHGIEQRMARIEQLLERLATAAESIATQPLARMDDVAIVEPSGSWRDMNGEVMN